MGTRVTIQWDDAMLSGVADMDQQQRILVDTLIEARSKLGPRQSGGNSRLRHYEGSDSCAPHLVHRSPRFSRTPLPTFRLQPRGWPGGRFTRHSQHVRCVSGFALTEQARRHSPPNRVRRPADRQFASVCSPPHLAATQLPSATGSWLAPTRTSTVLCVRPHERTRLCRPGTRRGKHRIADAQARTAILQRTIHNSWSSLTAPAMVVIIIA